MNKYISEQSNSSIRLIILAILLIFCCNVTFSQSHHTKVTSTPLTGANIETGQVLILLDPDAGCRDLGGTWNCDKYTDCYYKSYIHLGIDPLITQDFPYDDEINTITVEYFLIYIDSNDAFQVLTDQSLSIEYNSSGGINRDQQIQVLHGGHFVRLEVTDVSVGQVSDIPASVYLQLEMEFERFEDMDPSSMFPVTDVKFVDADGGNSNENFIKFEWDQVPAAEEYELEWTWVDDELVSGTDSKYDFRTNSTRIRTRQTSHTISNTYRKGIIVARMRGLGRSQACDQSVEGAWSLANIGAINCNQAHDYSLCIEQDQAHLEQFNWQHSRSFAEEGKQKDLITYFDGSMRSRQSVTRVESDENAIIAESYYDHIGRPAVQALPAPKIADNGASHNYERDVLYYPGFNLNENDVPYSLNDFELNSDECSSPAQKIGSQSGAGKYYSPDNPHQDEFQAFVPDAKGFPMSHSIYTQDGTNRVRFQGGVGSDHQVGSTHETKYYYALAAQPELDRLFGNEVGYAEYYMKNMVVDPNGQVSVSYLDNKDRVIATALAGESPASLLPLDSENGSSQNIHNVLIGDTESSAENRLDLEAGTVTMMSKFVVPSDGTLYEWNYDYTQRKFYDACAPEICFDCIYESKVEVRNDCNIYEAGDVEFIPTNAFSIDENCQDIDVIYQNGFSKELDQGGYTLSKQLRLSQDAQDQYEELYVDFDTCAEAISDIIDRLLADVEFIGCVDTPCAPDCIASIDPDDYAEDVEGYKEALLECLENCDEVQFNRTTCEFVKLGMLADLKPGGQYAQFEFDDEGKIVLPISSKTSILNTSSCPQIGSYADITYYGGIEIEINGEPTAPYDLSPEEFIFFHEDSWIEYLLPLHPEYSYYEHCVNELTPSNNYDDDIMETEAISDARTLGHLNPLGHDPGMVGASYDIQGNSNEIVDSFFQSGNAGDIYASEMFDRMKEYIELGENSGIFYSIWDVSYLFSLGQILDIGSLVKGTNLPDPGTFADSDVFGNLICQSDRFWEYFRSMYMSLKREYIDLSYGFNNSCIGSGILPVDGSFCEGCDSLTSKNLRRHFYQSTNSPIIDIPDDWLDYEDEQNMNIAERCDSMCSSYRGQWRYELASCFDLSITSQVHELEELLDEMVKICSAGCDLDHPFGASSLPNGETTQAGNNSFADALLVSIQNIDPNAEFDEMCNPYLISSPLPYGNDVFAGEDFTIDECACERYNQIYDEFEATNPPVNDLDNFHSWLTTSYHVDYDVDRIVNLDCACRTIDSPYKLHESVNASIIPPPFACTACIDCDQMITAYNYFLDSEANYYGTVTIEQIEDVSFQNILTAWLNEHLSFNLTFHEYREFMSYCGISINGEPMGNPYTPSPQFFEQVGYPIYNLDFTKEYLPENGVIPEPGATIRYSFSLANNSSDLIELIFTDQLPVGWAFIDPGPTVAGGIVSLNSPGTISISTLSLDPEETIYFELEVVISPDLNLERIYYNQAVVSSGFEKYHYSDDPTTIDTIGDATGVFVHTSDPCQGNVENTDDFLTFMNYLLANDLLHLDVPIDISLIEDEFILSSLNLWDIQYAAGSTLTIKFIEELGVFSFVIENACGNQAMPLCNFVLSGIDDLHTIAEFTSVEPLFYNDDDMNHDFEVDIILNNGEETTLLGSSDCYSWIPCAQRTLCNRSIFHFEEPPIETNCVGDIVDLAFQQAQLIYETEINNARERFRIEYPKKCLQNVQENLSQNYDLKEYHYTLYYYDQSGNLIRTIPPEGVDILEENKVEEVVKHRLEPMNYPAVQPAHEFITHYQHDSYNNTLVGESPDADEVLMWYDVLGRVVVSQDGRQRGLGLGEIGYYSYTRYDEQSRIIEVGETSNFTQMTHDIAQDYDAYEAWLSNSIIKRYVGRTIYDDNFISGDLDVDEYFHADEDRPYLRKRVSSSLFYDDYTNAAPEEYDFASHYDYDVHGNVKTLIQEFAQLKPIDQHLKRIDYYYDLISGNVNEVWYQHDEPDALYHRYTYDADNRITQVETSHDYIIWDKDAEYDYYVHGPLARSEIGTHKVQGIDYAYTIHGWIKGVNSNTLEEDRDMGLDGAQQIGGNLNTNSAEDAYGYSLGYYTDDYDNIAGDAAFLADENNAAFYELYNGNISRMVTSLKNTDHELIDLTPNVYRYDQLHRIKELQKFEPIDIESNKWHQSAINAYRTTYSYDANGNLTTLKRRDQDQLIDDLTYQYELDAGKRTNKLDYIKDGNNTHEKSLQGQDGDNYEYDGSGNLIIDKSEKINKITWDNYGKIRRVDRSVPASPEKPVVYYQYDAIGNRVTKLVITSNDFADWEITYYVRDAQGNIMATYSGQALTPLLLPEKLFGKEHHLYGSSRLGVKNVDQPELELGGYEDPGSSISDHIIGKRNYELSNHLGNVLAVVSDNKLLNRTPLINDDPIYRPEILQYSDYYPFGWEMPERNGSLSGEDGYRFGFNGKEKDRDLTGNEDLLALDYGFRIYNPAIGKFLSVDPLTASYPWYTPYQFAGNMPIWAIDRDGLEEKYATNGSFLGYGPDKTSNEIQIEGQTESISLHELLKLQLANNLSNVEKVQAIVRNQRLNKIFSGEVFLRQSGFRGGGAEIDIKENGDMAFWLNLPTSTLNTAINSASQRSLDFYIMILGHEYLHFFQQTAGDNLKGDKKQPARELLAHHFNLFPNTSGALDDTDFQIGKTNRFNMLDDYLRAFLAHQSVKYINLLSQQEQTQYKSYIDDIFELISSYKNEGYSFPPDAGGVEENKENFTQANKRKREEAVKRKSN